MSDDFDQLAPLAPAPSFTHDEMMAALAEVFGQDYADDFRDPVVFARRQFASPSVQGFYRRDFPLVSRTLFVENVYRRRPGFNQAVLDDFAALTSKKLEDVHRLLTTYCERMRKICQSNSADMDATYMHPINKVVPIIAGGAKVYIGILEKLDVVYQLTGSANLNGVIDGNQRKATEMLSRKAVRAFASMLRVEMFKLRKESQRMRAAAAGVDDKEVLQAEGAHDQAAQVFDEGVNQESQLDPGSAVAPEAAADLISDIAATTAANASKPRRRKTEAASDAAAPAAVTP
jgi:hypothetical protein